METDGADLRPEDKRPARSRWQKFGRYLRRSLPTGLYARSLLIVIAPMILLQTVVAAVFMERHWQMVTTRLAAAVVRDIDAVIEIAEKSKGPEGNAELVALAAGSLELDIAFEPPADFPPMRATSFFSILDGTLADQISQKIRRPFHIDSTDDRDVTIRVRLTHEILRVKVPVGRTYASNIHIFLVWMVGASLVLILIAILFLRGQIRPIVALARAADAFGKGQKLPGDFSPRGADEVRRAGIAFLRMRERIERQIDQRTAMLSGVSHDLRTILTRFRLQLAVATGPDDLDSLNRDVEDMQTMLEAYLAFARNQSEEHMGNLFLDEVFDRHRKDAEAQGKRLDYKLVGGSEISVRPNAFTRLVGNLVTNALRHGNHVVAETRMSARWLTMTIDDDGPGIPEDRREDVFKPFVRLDEARNLDASGTGLGLAIALDIARSHGGDITLSDSPLGGLRVMVRIPI